MSITKLLWTSEGTSAVDALWTAGLCVGRRTRQRLLFFVMTESQTCRHLKKPPQLLAAVWGQLWCCGSSRRRQRSANTPGTAEQRSCLLLASDAACSSCFCSHHQERHLGHEERRKKRETFHFGCNPAPWLGVRFASERQNFCASLLQIKSSIKHSKTQHTPVLHT